MERVKLATLLRETEVRVPDTDLVVTVRDLSWPDFMASLEIEDLVERGVYRLLKVLSRWNLVDDSDQPLPITAETIRTLPASVIFPLTEALKGHYGLGEKKKN